MWSVTDLHSNQATGLSPDLCVPDVVLGEIQGSLVLEHIWIQRHKILTKSILKVKILSSDHDFRYYITTYYLNV